MRCFGAIRGTAGTPRGHACSLTSKRVRKGRAMTTTFKAGDKVEWDSPQGKVRGTVEAKLTGPSMIKSHNVAASPDHPEYRVRSDRTGAQAAHKPGALKKR